VAKANIADISKLFLFLFKSNDVDATNVFKKISVTGNVSNNSGGLEAEPPAAGDKRGFGGGAPNAAAIFQFFFQEIKQFYAYFGLNFCLKTFFK